LTGISSASTTADSSGNYSFSGLNNGSYTVTPAKSGYGFTPPSQAAVINGANLGAVNFTGQSSGGTTSTLGLDASVSANSPSPSASIASAPVSTKSSNQLILALISTDYLSGANTTVKSVSGLNLTWTLVQRTNVQSGGSEIWRAFSTVTVTNGVVTASLSQSVYASISILSFSGVDTTGTAGSGSIGAIGTGNAAKGAPAASLTTTRQRILGGWRRQ
jgi:hypothetical protein